MHSEAHFDRDVEKGAGSTIPLLDLDRELDRLPESLAKRGRFPGIDLATLDGKDVLCIGAGGGQQSAIFGLLGARVTVLELSHCQLEGDRAAAAHYGYGITTIHGDMQDLSSLASESFDVVYTTSTMYVADLWKLYAECTRALRPNGVLTSGLLLRISEQSYHPFRLNVSIDFGPSYHRFRSESFHFSGPAETRGKGCRNGIATLDNWERQYILYVGTARSCRANGSPSVRSARKSACLRGFGALRSLTARALFAGPNRAFPEPETREPRGARDASAPPRSEHHSECTLDLPSPTSPTADAILKERPLPGDAPVRGTARRAGLSA